MEYRFYGWETATVPALTEEYKGIQTPRDLYDALSKVWCAETCAPRMRSGWSEANPTLGQCSVTAFLAQDIFGGEVYGIPREGGTYHCFNVVGDCLFDLTSEMFGDEVLDYGNCVVQSREEHFAKEEKRERYEILKERLRNLMEAAEAPAPEVDDSEAAEAPAPEVDDSEATEATEPEADVTESYEVLETVEEPELSEELQKALEKEAEDVEKEHPIFRDASGGFNWGLLAVILAVAMFLVAFVWLLSKAIKLFGSALLIVVALIIIIYTVFHIRE